MKALPTLDELTLAGVKATALLASVQSLIGAKCIAEVSEYADLVVYARISESAATAKLPAIVQFLSGHRLECAFDAPREGVMRIEISTRFG